MHNHRAIFSSVITVLLVTAPLAGQAGAGGAHAPGAQDSSAAAAAATLTTPAPASHAGQPPVSDTLHLPQDTHAAAAAGEHAEDEGDFIMHHIMDGDYIDIPWPNGEWMKRIQLPHWEPIQLGGLSIDISPTRHVVILIIVTLLCAAVLLTAARAHQKRAREGKPPRGLANAIEAVVLYIRSEVILANVGKHGEGFVPYLLTCFFFILFGNLFGLIPYSSTVTSNIAVTATLAVIAFFVVEIAGMRALGWGYLKTIFYWPHDMSLAMKLPLTLILTPVEFIGKFVKPFALAIRLFANMTAGHIVILALIGMVFIFGNIFIAPFPVAMAIGIMLLEVLIGFIQAFVFTLLVSVFIGQLREGEH